MSEQLEVVDCPDPSVHGSPFRYCPYCKWMEEPEPVEPSFEVQMLRVAIEALKAERDDLAAQLAQRNEWLSEHGGLDVLRIGPLFKTKDEAQSLANSLQRILSGAAEEGE